MKWLVRRADRYALRVFGDEAIVFNRANGDTHYLDILGLAVFQRLLEQPYSVDALMESISGEFQIDADDPLRESILQLLEKFVSLELADSNP